MQRDSSSSNLREGAESSEVCYQRVEDDSGIATATDIANVLRTHIRQVRSDGAWRRCSLWLDRSFQLSARGSTLAQEVWGGCISFVALSYNMLVIPVLLDKADPDEVSFEALLTASALSAAVGTFLVGVLGNAPVALIPGLRLNAYVVFGLCTTLGIKLGEALSASFVSGLLLFVLSVLGVCNWIARAVLSDHLKKAIAMAMGIFQATIGFQMMGLLELAPDDLVSQAGWDRVPDVGLYLSIAVFCIVSAILVSVRVDGALLLSISLIAIGSWVCGIFRPPDQIFASPSFETVLTLDFSGWFRKQTVGPLMLGTLAMLFMAIFDITGVQYGLYSIGGLLRSGRVPLSNRQHASVGIATMVAALLGVGPLIIANESSAGIMDGARTGMSSVVTSLLFLMSAFTTPLLASVPDMAAAAPLILIGAFMMEPSRSIAWDNLRVAIPCFLTITLVPHSIHNGMIAGIASDVLLGLMSRLTEGLFDQGPAATQDLPVASAASGGAPVVKDKRCWTPHSFGYLGIGLKETEKVERVRELLQDLGPPDNIGSQASDTWEITLRRALETYLDGKRASR